MNTNDERCPKCDVSLQGGAIPEESQHLYGATHFSLKGGLSDGDSVHTWVCPFCHYSWPRDEKPQGGVFRTSDVVVSY